MKRILLTTLSLAVITAATDDADAQSVSITFTTTQAGGNYAPRNVVAVWAEAADGTFVKTLGRWSNARTQHLVAWDSASGRDADAVSGATRSNHNTPLTVTWDMTDRSGAAVAEGIYTIRMELADRNSNTPDQNNQGTFTVDHNGTSAMQTTSGGGFDGVTIDYQATAGGPDAGPGGGGGGECVDDDGTCPAGCTTASDNDCTDNNDPDTGNGANIEGGCSVATGRGERGLLGLLFLVALGLCRRRRQDAR